MSSRNTSQRLESVRSTGGEVNNGPSTNTMSAKSVGLSPISRSKWCYNKFVSYTFQMQVTRYASVLLFLPFFMNFGFGSIDGTTLATSLNNGSLFYESSIAAVCLVVPLAIDMAIELCLQIIYKKSNNNKTSHKKKNENVRDFNHEELVHMLLGFLAVPLIAFVPRYVDAISVPLKLYIFYIDASHLFVHKLTLHLLTSCVVSFLLETQRI